MMAAVAGYSKKATFTCAYGKMGEDEEGGRLSVSTHLLVCG